MPTTPRPSRSSAYWINAPFWRIHKILTNSKKTMADNEKQSGGNLDKIVMGVILGGAIGSVLGLTLAPRKGKDTRKIIKEKGGEMLTKGKEVIGDAAQKIIRDHKETLDSAKYQMKKGKGFLRWLFGKKKTQEPMPRVTIDSEENE